MEHAAGMYARRVFYIDIRNNIRIIANGNTVLKN